jgi:hypothetical protein
VAGVGEVDNTGAAIGVTSDMDSEAAGVVEGTAVMSKATWPSGVLNWSTSP